MTKNWENNGTEEIGLVTPTPDQLCRECKMAIGIDVLSEISASIQAIYMSFSRLWPVEDLRLKYDRVYH